MEVVEHDPSVAAGMRNLYFAVQTPQQRPHVAVVSLLAEGPKGEVTFIRIGQINVFALPAAQPQRHAQCSRAGNPWNPCPFAGQKDITGAVQSLIQTVCAAPGILRMFGNDEG